MAADPFREEKALVLRCLDGDSQAWDASSLWLGTLGKFRFVAVQGLADLESGRPAS